MPGAMPGPARGGRLIPLAEQDRTRWHTDEIAEGVDLLQARARPATRSARIRRRPPSPRCTPTPAPSTETDWVQIVEWYDELLALTDSPVVRLNRAVAVGEADGAQAGLAALAQVDPSIPRHTAAAAHLREKGRGPVRRGPAVRRGRPRGAEPRRAGPPHPAGRPAQPDLAGCT